MRHRSIVQILHDLHPATKATVAISTMLPRRSFLFIECLQMPLILVLPNKAAPDFEYSVLHEVLFSWLSYVSSTTSCHYYRLCEAQDLVDLAIASPIRLHSDSATAYYRTPQNVIKTDYMVHGLLRN